MVLVKAVRNALCQLGRSNTIVCVCVCFRCECPPGYVGEHCELDYNDCEDNKCHNGAQCIDALNGYTCVCPEGYR